eukprot:scaffold48671_cov71-Phaeocystis_antarctica.AAC.9
MWIAAKHASQRKSRSHKISRRLRLQRGSFCVSLLLPPASATLERQPPRRATQPTESSEKTTATSTLCAANRPVVARPTLWRMFITRGT